MYCRNVRLVVMCAAGAVALLVLAHGGRSSDALPPAKAPSAEAAIQQALTKPAKFEFNETPLSEVVDFVRDQLRVPVLLHKKALDDVGIGTDTPVSFKLSGVSTRSALDLMLRDLDLTWVISDEVMLITTPEDANNRMSTKVYDVSDLRVAAEGPGEVDYDSLIQMMTTCVAASSWDSVGGPGSIAPFSAAGINALVVSQTQEVQEEIEDLLAQLRKIRHVTGTNPLPKPIGVQEVPGVPPAAAPPAAGQPRGAADAERAIRQALAKPVDLAAANMPLAEAAKTLRTQAGIPIVLDRRRLAEAGVEGDTPITITLKGHSLRSTLNLMLLDLKLAWTVDKEVLLITTPEQTQEYQTTKTYDVTDLPSWRGDGGRGEVDLDGLKDTITSTIDPTSWEDVGGPGTIESYIAPGIQAIVVSQSWQAQEKVGAMLEAIRKVRGRPLTKEEIEKLPLTPPPQPEPRDMGGGMW